MFASYDKITTYHQPGVSGNYPLPVVLSVTYYHEFEWRTNTRTVEEAKLLAESMITGRLFREFDFAIDIIERRVDFHQLEDSLQVRALIITHERIDAQQPISIANE